MEIKIFFAPVLQWKNIRIPRFDVREIKVSENKIQINQGN